MRAVVCLPGGCEVTEVPDPRPAAGEVAALLGLPRARIVELPSGVELDLFRRRPLDRGQRLAHWRRWLVEQPLG